MLKNTIVVIAALTLALALPIAAMQPQVPASTQKVPATVAMVFLVDTSGSMTSGQLNVAREAAKTAVKALRDSDRFGTLSFGTRSTWIAPLQSAGNRDAIGAQLEAMSAGGGTDIYVGLNAAYEALKDSKDAVKVVVLLSDGMTQPADYQGLATTMLKAGINVSSITVGTASNRQIMADIAMWGKGRAYYINSYDRVPQVLVKEAELAVGKTP